jgi:hypothetical protein
MRELPDLVVAYGISDEFRYADLYDLSSRNSITDTMCLASSSIKIALFSSGARGFWLPNLTFELWEDAYVLNSKLTTTIVSTFSSYYVYLWPKYFPDTPLTPPLPSFDGRAVVYPSVRNLRDYMSWRQVDCKCDIFYVSMVIKRRCREVLTQPHFTLISSKAKRRKLRADLVHRPHQQSLQHHLLGFGPAWRYGCKSCRKGAHGNPFC